MQMVEINATGTRLERLKALSKILAEQIDACASSRDLPQLARQYRDTIREIAELEGEGDQNDEISEILKRRKADGKSDSVRKGRA